MSAINPARVDFVTLRLFCEIARMGSLTRGASSCNLALSAASRRLSDFEASTGTQLFERSAHGVSLTPAGALALQHATRLFQSFERFSFEINEFSKGARGHVRLWANMSALVEFLPMQLSSFMAQHSGIRVEVEEQLSSDTVRALMEGLADVGVIAENVPAPGLALIPFHTDELIVLCRADHPLARRRKIQFADCVDSDMVGLNDGSSLLELTTRAAADLGTTLRIRVQVRSFDAMCEMVSANLGMGVLPVAACRPHLRGSKLKAVKLTDAWAQRHLLVAYNPNRQLSPPAELLLDVLVPQWRSTRSLFGKTSH